MGQISVGRLGSSRLAFEGGNRMYASIPKDWHAALASRPSDAELAAIMARVEADRSAGITVYPPRDQVFAALHLTPLDSVRAVIVGQDPYHGPGQAHGLAFSVVPPCTRPPSLRNILAELASDTGTGVPDDVSLVPWARHGVLLLNTSLTVRAGTAGSHVPIGWRNLTTRIIEVVAAQPRPIAFLLWGRHAQAFAASIDDRRHAVLCTTHPSPLSARKGFLRSRPFTGANARLRDLGADPIDWSLAAGGRPQ
ncbi:MAG: uracil-DNA glycosylase [Chloroflexota bacterium]